MAQTVERVKPVTIFHGQTSNINGATVLGASADLVASEVTIKAMVTNVGSVFIGSHVDVGGTTVTAANGFEIRAGQQVTVTAGSPSELYVIAATGTADDVSWIAT